jgi:hypothetical protein
MSFDKRIAYEAFRASLPVALQDDRFFAIFYSDIRPSPIAVIGLNPGGDPAVPSSIRRVSTLYEHDEHEYVDMNYPIAMKMRDLLVRSGAAANITEIRGIPKFNVIFHRSASWQLLNDKNVARRLAAPHVAAMLHAISPHIVIIDGLHYARAANDATTGPSDESPDSYPEPDADRVRSSDNGIDVHCHRVGTPDRQPLVAKRLAPRHRRDARKN